MERYAWKAAVLPGRMAEYRRRHDEIWPEMLEMFRRAGIRNYSIWQTGDTLFGYYECDDPKTALCRAEGCACQCTLARVHARRDPYGTRPEERRTAASEQVFFLWRPLKVRLLCRHNAAINSNGRRTAGVIDG